MSFAGSVSDMITRSNYLRSMRQGTYQNRKARMRRMYVDSLHLSNATLKDTISPEVQAKVRAEIREKMRAEKRRNAITVTIIMFLLAALVTTVFVLVLA